MCGDEGAHETEEEILESGSPEEKGERERIKPQKVDWQKSGRNSSSGYEIPDVYYVRSGMMPIVQSPTRRFPNVPYPRSNRSRWHNRFGHLKGGFLRLSCHHQASPSLNLLSASLFNS